MGWVKRVATAVAILAMPTVGSHAAATRDVAGTAKPAKTLVYLNPADFRPALLLPPPPPRGSMREREEMAELRRLIAAAGPARHARALWDDKHKKPVAFDAVTGRDLAALPATRVLLAIVQREAAIAAGFAKGYFHRARPYQVDPTIPHCPAEPDDDNRSYPSGHATFGYAVGYTLAHLMPDRAQAILARANDYAMNRAICGVHFPSDLEAGHVIGTLAATRLLADPRLAGQIAAARTELAGR